MDQLEDGQLPGPPVAHRGQVDGEDPGHIYDEMLEMWRVIGFHLREARRTKNLSKREAATRAGFSEALWRHLEAGSKLVDGVLTLPNPKDSTLEAAANAVGIPPRSLFNIAQRLYHRPTPRDEVSLDDVQAKIRHLSPRDLTLVSALADEMLGLTNSAPLGADSDLAVGPPE